MEANLDAVFLVIQVVLTAVIGALVKTLWDHSARLNKVEIINATIVTSMGHIGDNIKELKDNNARKFDRLFNDLEEIKINVSQSRRSPFNSKADEGSS